MVILELDSWSAFKGTCITVKGLNCQYSDKGDRYELYGPDRNGILWHASILKEDPAGVDQAEFEVTYKSTFNGKIIDQQLDSDGAPMSRIKVAPSGWNFNLRGIDFATSTGGSLVNRDTSNADLGDVAVKYYDAEGALLTDQGALATCVKTIVDIEPPYDIYVAGGKLRLLTQPNEDVRLSVVGVPDVPALAGGSKGFVQNINLRYIPVSEGVNADGRAAKWLQYNATYHTNKLRFILYHGAGFAAAMEILIETYKA
jgi:hypothetical protein